jgi:O-antigen/teichoic acid export membrane protein/glycosyltransferase involved in cell wall biosynthesis
LSLSRRILSGTAVQIAARLVVSLAGFAILVVAARTLSSAAFGRYTYYLTTFVLAAYFINSGCDAVALREIARDRRGEPTILGGVVRFKLAAALVVIAAIAALAWIYEATLASRLLVILASTHLLGQALATPVVSFQARLRFGLPSVARIAGSLCFLIAGLVYLLLGERRPEILLVLFGAGHLVYVSIVLVASRSLVRFRFDQTRQEFASFFREMAPIGLAAIANSLYMYMDTLFLRQLSGEAAVGYYNAAYRLLVFALIIPGFFAQTLFPVLSRCHTHHPELFAQLMRRAVLYLLLVGAPLAVSLQLLARPIVHGLYGQSGGDTVQVLAVLGWAMLLAFASFPFITALTAIRRQVAFMKIALAAAALNGVLNVFWIPSFGIVGAAWATVITEAMVLALAAGVLVRATAILPLTTELWKVPVAGAAMGVLSWWIRDWNLVPVLIVAALGMVATLYLLRCLPIDLLRGASPDVRAAADTLAELDRAGEECGDAEVGEPSESERVGSLIMRTDGEADSPSVSVVVPAHNAARQIETCLAALNGERAGELEIIVVDDASTDDTAARARTLGAQVIELDRNAGPSVARNLGASRATGDVLLFVDADVVVAPGTLRRVRAWMRAHPHVAAVFGSYDAAPVAEGTLSRYRNLLHHHLHQLGRAEASTFWAGCGAIRRDVFMAEGGFDEHRFPRCIEDIELGYRLRAAGHALRLDRELTCKHLKRWTLPNVVWTDVFCRAIPWSRLDLERAGSSRDLNIGRDQRISVALTLLAVLGLILAPWYHWLLPAAALTLLLVMLANARLYFLLLRRGGVGLAAAGVPLHLLYFLYSGGSYLWVWLALRFGVELRDGNDTSRAQRR